MRRFDVNQLPTGSYSISGSFSGSFFGDGSGLTGLDAFPYTGSAEITGSLTLDGPFTITGSIESPTSITFDTTATDADAIARLKWNETEGTLDLGMGGGLATLQIGQELYYPKVVNKSGEDLINGTLVMVDPAQPAQGNRLRVIRAVTDGTYPSELIVGPLTEDVDNNQEGFATWFGYVRNLNRTDLENNGIKDPTDTWVEGSILYTNPNLDGGYTSSMQPAPSGKSSIAAVTAVNGQNITLLVRPKLDTNVGNLHDVTDLTTTSSYGDLFIKSGDIWTTGKSLSGSYSLSGSLTALEISGSFSGSFQGDGSGLTNIPASGIVGLNLSQIASGSVSASISPTSGLQINTNVTAPAFTGSFTGSFIGDGSQLTGIVSSKWSGSNPITRNSDVEITGSFKVAGQTALYTTGSGTLTVQGSGSAQPLFLVTGSVGELLSVTDQDDPNEPLLIVSGSAGQLFVVENSTTGSLLQIYDTASNSIFEINNDAEIIYGISSSIFATQYLTIETTASYQTIYNIETGSYTGAFINYTVTSASNAAAGQIMSVWNYGTASYTETATTDIGDTSQIAFDVVMTGSVAQIAVSASLTTGWQVKTTLNIL